MIIDFSSLGTGAGKQVDLCSECKYFMKVSCHDRAPQVTWLTGAQIMEQYGSKDVKLTVHGIRRCARHAARGGVDAKVKPAFMDAVLKSGADISEDVDEYRYNILRSKF